MYKYQKVYCPVGHFQSVVKNYPCRLSIVFHFVFQSTLAYKISQSCKKQSISFLFPNVFVQEQGKPNVTYYFEQMYNCNSSPTHLLLTVIFRFNL